MDDTLVDDVSNPHPRACESIKRAKAQGVVVTLATGRMFQSAKPCADKLHLDLPLVTYNGGLVKESISGEVLLHKPVSYELCLEVIDYSKIRGLTLNLYIDDNLKVSEMNDEVQYYVDLAAVPVDVVGDLEAYLKRLDKEKGHHEAVSTKLLIVAPPPIVESSRQELAEEFEGRLHITRSKPKFLEMTMPGVSKASALQHLAMMWGFSQGEIMAIGDSLNDLEMLEYAGLGVAVANASDDVKMKADIVTSQAGGAGVAEVIEKFVLGGSFI